MTREEEGQKRGSKKDKREIRGGRELRQGEEDKREAEWRKRRRRIEEECGGGEGGGGGRSVPETVKGKGPDKEKSKGREEEGDRITEREQVVFELGAAAFNATIQGSI